MNFLKNLRTAPNFKTYAGIMTIALVFIIFSCIALAQPEREMRDTQGTIVDIVETYDFDTETYEHTVLIDYKVAGNWFKGVEYGSYNNKMKIGDKVTVQYDVTDPSVIQAPGSEKVPYIILAVGILIEAFCVVMLIKRKPY